MLEEFDHFGGLVAGCDEAGRGCLAGPVFAAAVILPSGFKHKDLNDSKQVGKAKRNKLRDIIIESSVAWSVAQCSADEIDSLNILWASIEAMHKALDGLKIAPSMLLIDGNKFKNYKDLPHQCIIKGDSKYTCISAASILAKTFRDDYMKDQSLKYPQYGWEQNNGYGTKKHIQALKTFGITNLHRKTFKPVRQAE